MEKANKEIYGIQLLRGIAALSVIFHHSLEESSNSEFGIDWITTFGASGVDIFFVISGFIVIYTSFPKSGNKTSPLTFLLRRATRIYPLYWLCCLAMLGIMLIGFLRNNRLELHEIALSLALLPSPKLILGVSWTLAYEMYFYLVFAITLPFRSPLISAIGSTAVIASFALAGNALDINELRIFLTNPIVYEFVFGLWLAIAFAPRAGIGRRWSISPAWAVLGFILLAIAPAYVAHASTAGLPGWPRVLAWGLPSVLIVASFLSIDKPNRAFQLQIVGDASYALYLTHIFVMIGYGFLVKKTFVALAPQITIVPLLMLLALIVGIFVHFAVEKPLLRVSRQWMGRKQPSLQERAGRNGLASDQLQ